MFFPGIAQKYDGRLEESLAKLRRSKIPDGNVSNVPLYTKMDKWLEKHGHEYVGRQATTHHCLIHPGKGLQRVVAIPRNI